MTRKLFLDTCLAELDRLSWDPESRVRRYRLAWALFDRRARLDWLAACGKVFPLRGESATPDVERAADAIAIATGVDSHELGGVG